MSLLACTERGCKAQRVLALGRRAETLNSSRGLEEHNLSNSAGPMALQDACLQWHDLCQICQSRSSTGVT